MESKEWNGLFILFHDNTHKIKGKRLKIFLPFYNFPVKEMDLATWKEEPGQKYTVISNVCYFILTYFQCDSDLWLESKVVW